MPIGTLLAAILAFPMGFLAARNATPNRFLNAIARFILVATRSVNTLLWALFFVAVFGPGVIEETNANATRAVRMSGVNISQDYASGRSMCLRSGAMDALFCNP